MRAFDFDKTIYNGYSFKNFCFYSSFRRPWTILYSLFVIIPGCILKGLRIIGTKKLVEIAIRPYIGYKNMDKHIDSFWDKHKKKLNKWFVENTNESDLLISASFDFFLERPAKILGIKNIIASQVDFNTKKVIDPYCYKEGKWQKFVARYGEDASIDEYYTDSYRDSFMLDKAKAGYIVKKGIITKVK